MVLAPGTALEFVTLAHNSAQALPHQLIFPFEDVVHTMLEVRKPAPQRSIHILDYFGHRMRTEPPRFLAYGFPEFVSALLARPAMAPLEVVSQEVESASLAGIDNARFGRVQR